MHRRLLGTTRSPVKNHPYEIRRNLRRSSPAPARYASRAAGNRSLARPTQEGWKPEAFLTATQLVTRTRDPPSAGAQPASSRRLKPQTMSSAASPRSPRRLLRCTLIVLAAGALVVPPLSSGHSSDHPPPPARFAVLAATPTSVTWSWEPEGTADSFNLYKNGRFVVSTRLWKFTLDGLECGLSYVLGVEAVDTHGRHSARASVIRRERSVHATERVPTSTDARPHCGAASRDPGSGVQSLSRADDTDRDYRAHDDHPARYGHSSCATEHLADRRCFRVA